MYIWRGGGEGTCRAKPRGGPRAAPALGERSAAGRGLGRGIKFFCFGENEDYFIFGAAGKKSQLSPGKAGDGGSRGGFPGVGGIPGTRLPQIAEPPAARSLLFIPRCGSEVLPTKSWGGWCCRAPWLCVGGEGRRRSGIWGGLHRTPWLPPASAPVPVAMARSGTHEAEGYTLVVAPCAAPRAVSCWIFWLIISTTAAGREGGLGSEGGGIWGCPGPPQGAGREPGAYPASWHVSPAAPAGFSPSAWSGSRFSA